MKKFVACCSIIIFLLPASLTAVEPPNLMDGEQIEYIKIQRKIPSKQFIAPCACRKNASMSLIAKSIAYKALNGPKLLKRCLGIKCWGTTGLSDDYLIFRYIPEGCIDDSYGIFDNNWYIVYPDFTAKRFTDHRLMELYLAEYDVRNRVERRKMLTHFVKTCLWNENAELIGCSVSPPDSDNPRPKGEKITIRFRARDTGHGKAYAFKLRIGKHTFRISKTRVRVKA